MRLPKIEEKATLQQLHRCAPAGLRERKDTLHLQEESNEF